MDNLEEMDKFLERYKFPRLNQEEIGNTNRQITSNKIRNEKDEITRDKKEIQRVISDYYKQLMAIKWKTWKKWTNS